MLISPLTQSDFKEASRLHKLSFFKGWEQKDFEAFLKDNMVCGLKFEEANTICGFILWREIRDEAEILTIVVSPNWQRKGIGSALLKELFTQLSKNRISNLFIEVAEDNESAQLFYKKNGFGFVGKRPHYYPRGENKFVSALNYKKSLILP
jgi:[ribosomal protein S18]-alanine N-acetyltransferase